MCTGIRFDDNNGNMYFGRNLDWSTGYGQKVVITPKNYRFRSAFLGDLAMKYPVIGMAIIEENTPLYFDCMNDAGLGVAGLNFPGYTHYETGPIDGKFNVSAYEFPLFLAANFKTVDEVEKILTNVAIVDKPINEKFPTSMLHWLIGDGKRSIVVEYTKGGMHVHDNDVDVLTNQPTFDWHKENLRNYMNLENSMPEKVTWGSSDIQPFGSGSMMRGLPGDYSSPSRFIRVAYTNTHYPTKTTEAENICRLFHTLASVAMVDGAAKMADGQFEKTIYTSGFSAATNTYYYNTYEDFTLKTTKLSDYNLDGDDLMQID